MQRYDRLCPSSCHLRYSSPPNIAVFQSNRRASGHHGSGTVTAEPVVVIVRIAGLVASAGYAGFVVWLYVTQPQTVAQVTGGIAAGVGVYSLDQQAAADGMAFFRRDAFTEARAAFLRADPARRDARTQFYI